MTKESFYNLGLLFLIFSFTKTVSGDSVNLQTQQSDYGNSLNPTQLTLNLQLGSDQIALNLALNKNASSLALVVLGTAGVLTPWFEQRTNDFAVYTDPSANRLSSILVLPQRAQNGDISRQYQGIFQHNDQYYYLSQDSSAKRKKRSSSSQYTATIIQQPTLQYGPQLVPTTMSPYSAELLTYVSANQTKASYIVDVLVVVDYAIYAKWYSSSDKTTAADKQTDAINGIRYYYAQIVNGINLRYNNIQVSDFTFTIRLAGYYIATTPSDSYWTQQPGLLNIIDGVAYVNASGALQAFQNWIGKTVNNLPIFDQATLFTGNSMMFGYYSDGSVYSISGLADIQGMCTPGRVSICKENGEYSSTETSAHEMGHNLGSLHDGDQNTCDANAQNIMSAAPAQLTSSDFDNPYYFSPCSIDYMRTYMNLLTMMKSNCLIESATHLDPGQVVNASKLPPGQFIDIDQQCQHLYGANSFYCGGMANDLIMCSQLWCYDPDIGRCTTNDELRAATGTTCGNRKWCSMGNCVYNASAPVASDFCLSGDYRGDVIDCKSVIGSDTGLCYQAYYNSTCCESCLTVQELDGAASCPYGDSDPNYCKNSIQAQDCYDPSIQQTCCSTCKQYQTNINGCEYGNTASWCATSDSSICYTSLSTCCETCYYMYLGYPDCPYGDKASWCTGIPENECQTSMSTCCLSCDKTKTTPKPRTITTPSRIPVSKKPYNPNCVDTASWCKTMPSPYCYTTQQICCGTCLNYYNDKPGCEYGSRFDWCKTIPKSECAYLENQADCCTECPPDLASSNGTDEFPATNLTLNSNKERSKASRCYNENLIILIVYIVLSSWTTVWNCLV